MEEKLLTIKEVSDYLNVSVNTLYGWIHQGIIPYTKCGHLVRFNLAQIDGWIRENSFSVNDELKKKP